MRKLQEGAHAGRDGRSDHVGVGLLSLLLCALLLSPACSDTSTQELAGETSACDPSYGGVCIPPGAPDLDCDDVGATNFSVAGPDPHGFDADSDGIGCEA